ncbi:MAG: hypothetical protein AB7G47_07585 [Mycolicibacterium sp.]|uniref:hypothetical protein n=1 Tax=Mycolicibacterium sp. TaxID=2320850 RepID=UPI003D141E96
MLSAIAIVPSAPVMVPELVGAAFGETADLRTAAAAAAGTLPSRWIGIGVADCDTVAGPDSVGTFGGYGVGVRVGLSEQALAASGPAAKFPLCVLITAWLRGLASPGAAAQVNAYRSDLDSEAALTTGRRLRAEIEDGDEPVGVLVVADGCNTLSPAAPGGFHPDAIPVQAALDDALAAGDVQALTRLPDGIIGRVAFQVLAGLAQPAPCSAAQLYRGAPYGVGYFVGIWHP